MGQLNLINIKNAIKNILDSANTSTASPVDLSANLTRRVQKVLTVNPEKIPVQDSFFPCVTCHVESKDLNQETMARSQTIGKRKADITMMIAVGLYENTVTDNTQDEASNQIEYLAENVEEILRANTKLSATADWSMIDNVQYYASPIDQETNIRSAELTLKITTFY
jgi:hypothetical protein